MGKSRIGGRSGARGIGWLTVGWLAAAMAPAAAQTCALDWLSPQVPSSIGDPAMAPVMDALVARYRRLHPGDAPPQAWSHRSADAAIGALMFARADLAPITRAFTRAELAPYAHQYHGDMMKAPVAVSIGSIAGKPAWIAVNKRPDAPLPSHIVRFLTLALSAEGQAELARVPGFKPLEPTSVATELVKLGGFLVPLDPDLPTYRTVDALSGSISSVGSDGMKDLMDGWECRFRILQPGIDKGERWEHSGTLNGFHALLAGETDIAPMGRELWPLERAAWASLRDGAAPREVRVARGGFNTQQRTTAQAIFVHPDNPLRQIDLAALAEILVANPGITRWGQLGLTGDWAGRPITVRIPPMVAPNAMSLQMMLLGSRGWNAAAVEAPIAETAKALSEDRYAIGFGGLEEGAPGLRPLAIAPRPGETPVPLDAESAATGRYPLARYMFIRLSDGAPTPQTVAFLRYVLSREGQERVRYSGYFPLTAAEVAQELEKLEALSLNR